MSILDEAKKEMSQSIEHLSQELKGIRTGRANPHLLDGVMIEAYGTHMRLTDIASVTAPDPRQLLVSPFDANNAGLIGKGIDKANLGVQSIVEGSQVRILIQPPDENVRKDLVKHVKKRSEDCKVAIRNSRRKYNEKIRDQKANGDISEDVMKKQEKQIQTFTDDFCKKADEVAAVKEKEIMHI